MTRKMSRLYLVKLNVFFTASNNGIWDTAAKFDEISLEICKLSSNDLHFLEFDELREFVNYDELFYIEQQCVLDGRRRGS